VKHRPPSLRSATASYAFGALLFFDICFLPAAHADGPVPPAPKSAKVVSIPALPAGAEAGIYSDPRKRFAIRHDASWRLMVNWAGGVEAFCRWDDCRTSALTSCGFHILPAEGMKESDLALFATVLDSGVVGQEQDMGFLGSVVVREGAAIREIAKRRWFVSGVGVKLFDTVPIEAREWWSIADGRMLQLSCVAHERIMPRLTREADRLLSGFTLTSP
jgi:hypothetical protein